MKDWVEKLKKWTRNYLIVYIIIFILWVVWRRFEAVLSLPFYLFTINWLGRFVLIGAWIALPSAVLQVSNRFNVFLVFSTVLFIAAYWLMVMIFFSTTFREVVEQTALGDQHYILVYEDSTEWFPEYNLFECDDVKRNCRELYFGCDVLGRELCLDEYHTSDHPHYLGTNEDLNEIYVFEQDMMRFVYSSDPVKQIEFDDDLVYILKDPKLLERLSKEYFDLRYHLFIVKIPESDRADLILYHCMQDGLPRCEVNSFRYRVDVAEVGSIALVERDEELHLRVDDELIYSYDGETGVCYVDGCWAP